MQYAQEWRHIERLGTKARCRAASDFESSAIPMHHRLERSGTLDKPW